MAQFLLNCIQSPTLNLLCPRQFLPITIKRARLTPLQWESFQLIDVHSDSNPLFSFGYTGGELLYAIPSMRSGEDKTINGIGSPSQIQLCVHARPAPGCCKKKGRGKRSKIWHSLFSSLQVCWLNTVHTFDFLRLRPRR